jgi:hypothetical protein
MLKQVVLALCLGAGVAFTSIRPAALGARLRAQAAARTLYDKVQRDSGTAGH